jgi:predicted amidophosphoribosyltransferase
MNTVSVAFGLLIVLFTILLLRSMLKLKPPAARLGSQRMCPSCGLITPRLRASCMECGQPFAAVVYSTSKK